MKARVEAGCLMAAVAAVCLEGCGPASKVSPAPPLVEVVTVTQSDVPVVSRMDRHAGRAW